MLPAQSASADVSMHSSPLSLALSYNIPAHRLALDMPTFPRYETSGTIGNASLAGCAEAKSRYLCDEIMALLKENWIGLSPEGQYVPDAKLAELLTESSVHDALGGTDRPLTLFVIGEATQVFATLLLVFADWKRRAHAMRYFQGTYFTDEKLRNQISGVSPHCPLREHGACQHHFPRELWEEKDVAHFKSQRWNFLLHSFNHLVFQDEIDINQLLPFVRKVPHNELNHGNFSEVTCVQMLASKQTKKNCQSELISVALKTLKRIDNGKYDIDKEWRRESQAYKHLNDRSPHIIEAIAAVRQVAARPQNDVYHFVLEWADGGSLHNFIEEHPESQLKSETHHDVEQTRKRVMQMLEQLCGLADALHSMHITTIKSPRSSQQVTLRPSLVPPSGHTAPGAVPDLADSPMPFTGEALPIIEVHASEEPQVDRGYTSNIQYSRPEAEGLSVSAGTSLRRWGSDIHSSNWRHGDIKPENILRFIDGKEDAWIGTLKLADLGRAQQHQLKTILRETKETELWRTRWYEPPDLVTEVHEKAEQKISRLFDVWSIGCVIFETVLWMLYGKVSIADFLQANELAPNEQDATPYWRKMAPGDYRVTDAATSWMDHVLQIDSEGDCALGHLVRVVKDRLLKIDLPPDTDEFSPGFRTNAGDLREQLRQIIDRGHENEEYLFSGADRSRIPRPSPRGSGSTIPVRPKSRSLLAPDDAEGHRNKRLGGSPKESPSRATMIAQQRVYTNQLDDRWRGSNDDNFIRSVLLSRQATSTESDLCDTCRGRDILASQNSFDVMNNPDCTLCTMVSDGVGDLNTDQDDLVSLERVMDSLVLRGTKTKILRLFRPEAVGASQETQDLLIGAPNLINPLDTERSAYLPKAWLTDCDDNHHATCTPGASHLQLPKRLIDVRKPKMLKLVDSDTLDETSPNSRYIAFSHKWGDMPANAKTTIHNIEVRRKRMTEDKLPASFQHVITLTRKLGCHYLWIDCICITQGEGGDFAEQADKMQTTFSNAYCVIAASSAEGAKEGFLKNRELITCNIGDVSVSSVTNDFERDVLQSPLSRRGWVLQERALARRTIFVTDNQMYWECGDGIRCETLAKLKNDEAAFLGDPNFPEYTIRPESNRGEQIHHFTRLFRQYSGLEFSHPEDRPIAIDSLMLRLTSAFKTRSLAGLFDAFWGRCLLWQRPDVGNSTPLSRIPFGEHSKKTPPSWSWMAVQGVISFLEPQGGEVGWNDTGVKIPSTDGDQVSWLKTKSGPRESFAIRAQVFDFTTTFFLMGPEVYLVWDGVQAVQDAKCVVIGTGSEDPQSGERKRYVMLVARPPHAHGVDVYERVGVGHLPEKYIRADCAGFATIE